MTSKPLHLGKIRMSPLMYGSLRYIATRHSNGTLNLTEISELKQTQLRSFKKHEWIARTPDKEGIAITKEGRQALRSFEDNDEFFRKAANMSFTALLDLKVPEEVERIRPVSVTLANGHNKRAHAA